MFTLRPAGGADQGRPPAERRRRRRALRPAGGRSSCAARAASPTTRTAPATRWRRRSPPALARGLDLEAAVHTGKAFVTGAVADSFPLGAGAGSGRALLAGARLARGRGPLPRLSRVPTLLLLRVALATRSENNAGCRVSRRAQAGGEGGRRRTGVVGLGDRPDHDGAPRAVGDHLVQPVERLDAADREPRPRVLPRRPRATSSDESGGRAARLGRRRPGRDRSSSRRRRPRRARRRPARGEWVERPMSTSGADDRARDRHRQVVLAEVQHRRAGGRAPRRRGR